MQWLMRFAVIAVFFITASTSTMAASSADALTKARKEYICSCVSLAAYDGRIHEFARSELAQRGWQVEQFHENTKAADAKFYLVKGKLERGREPINILAVTGTETKQDIKNDIRFGKVPFGGASGPAFIETAGRKNLNADFPLVHSGFNDYTNALYFMRDGQGRLFGEALQKMLQANPKEKLLLTGHSLGGAVATLLAARLVDTGVSPNQLEVITFGAPAVGNQAFADIYGKRLTVDRVTIKNDPVRSILQTITFGNYAQFGTKTEWYRNENSDKFFHSVTLYVDAALRNYYDIFQQAETEYSDSKFLKVSGSRAKVYVTPFKFTLDDAIANDKIYMELSLKDGLRDKINGVVFSPKNESTYSLYELCRAARKAGCAYVLCDTFVGKRIRNVEYAFKMSMQEEVYDTDGVLVAAYEVYTNTDIMTPIEALLYNQVKARRNYSFDGNNVSNVSLSA